MVVYNIFSIERDHNSTAPHETLPCCECRPWPLLAKCPPLSGHGLSWAVPLPVSPLAAGVPARLGPTDRPPASWPAWPPAEPASWPVLALLLATLATLPARLVLSPSSLSAVQSQVVLATTSSLTTTSLTTASLTTSSFTTSTSLTILLVLLLLVLLLLVLLLL